jgi:transcriptional antiterminator RfaH
MNEKHQWYLVFTKVKSELKAKEHLTRQGYITYLPMAQKRVRRNCKYVYITEPFFPRYLFIKLNTETDNWGPIRSTVGVSCIVRFGGVSAVVPEDLIVELQQQENEIGLHKGDEKQLRSGDKIMVLDGPFAGYQGIFQSTKSAERIAILLDIVGRNIAVTLSMHDLRIA